MTTSTSSLAHLSDLDLELCKARDAYIHMQIVMFCKAKRWHIEQLITIDYRDITLFDTTRRTPIDQYKPFTRFNDSLVCIKQSLPANDKLRIQHAFIKYEHRKQQFRIIFKHITYVLYDMSVDSLLCWQANEFPWNVFKQQTYGHH